MRLKAISEKNPLLDNSQKLAENLRVLLKSHNLNANQLAQILGIPMMTIRRLLSGETTDPRISTLKLVADHFNISIDSLIDGDNQTIIKSLKKTKPHFIPILDWDTTAKISTLNELDLSKWKEWQSISLNEKDIISKNAFALESRPSMYPRFPQGTIFLIDPDTPPTDGDVVLVKLKKNNELTLRELAIDPPEWQLHPVVLGSNILHYSEQNHKIVGVNLLTMLYNRKING
jgi:transcriptional regulator with XRE-family HTH domain